jgi:RimJ/RimL family protein N-acetyltransferase
MPRIETARLIIRSFTPDDWEGIQALAVDKETLKRDPHDPPWPTSDDECKGFAQWLANKSGQFFAACLKSDQTLIGLLAFNSIDENRQLELGYQFHSSYQDNDLDREALESIVDYAFESRDVTSIETKTNPEWTEQLAPLESFGFAPIKGDRGNWGITKTDWERRHSA